MVWPYSPYLQRVFILKLGRPILAVFNKWEGFKEGRDEEGGRIGAGYRRVRARRAGVRVFMQNFGPGPHFGRITFCRSAARAAWPRGRVAASPEHVLGQVDTPGRAGPRRRSTNISGGKNGRGRRRGGRGRGRGGGRQRFSADRGISYLQPTRPRGDCADPPLSDVTWGTYFIGLMVPPRLLVCFFLRFC